VNRALASSITLGAIVGNIVIYRFIFERDWFNSIRIGLTAGMIIGLLYGIGALISNWRRK